MEIRPIAHIQTDLTTKFGVPRQSGVCALQGRIVFEKEYRVADAFRGLEDFSYIWLLWDFSEAHRAEWSPTVRPPRLGGNKRMGVFATRSPFRPNNIGLSSVKLIKIDYDSTDAPVLIVEGADLMNGTPIYDVKPYLPYTDAHPDAHDGFVSEAGEKAFQLNATITDELRQKLTAKQADVLCEILSNDPRPHYQRSADREYVLPYNGLEIRFRVNDDKIMAWI